MCEGDRGRFLSELGGKVLITITAEEASGRGSQGTIDVPNSVIEEHFVLLDDITILLHTRSFCRVGKMTN